jgi:U3 small nucleolar RNA-associated protein 10
VVRRDSLAYFPTLTRVTAFWRDDKLRLASPALVQQTAVCIRLGGSAESKALVSECLVALTDSAADDALLKAINLDLLMHTRSDDARLRVFALSCSAALWDAHGGKFLGALPSDF